MAHKAVLVSALSRALSARVVLLDFTVGRKGLLNYLKALGGSNIVKVVPSNGSASDSQAAVRRLKVVCGANTSHIADNAWIRESKGGKGTGGSGTPYTFCEVKVSPSNTVIPNVGTTELAEALNKVLPFTSRDSNRPVLRCVNFTAREGKLTLVSTDGFRLAVTALQYDGEGQALIDSSDLKGIANALRRAKRARISFEPRPNAEAQDLILDTDLIRYRFSSVDGSFPDWEAVMPSEVKTTCHFDTIEAIKAIGGLKALADEKAYAIDMAIDGSKVVLSDPDNRGQSEISADVDGESVTVRLNGGYLVQALKACGGMVDMKLTAPSSPVLFNTNGYRLLTMPMARGEAPKAPEPQPDVVAQAEAVAEAVEMPEPVAAVAHQPEARRPKRKHKARQAAAVA
ncbi:MAG: DNA polymerase III subunit beta [Dehalococcoidia bacterium]|nr:DNA polymerase III subunit beta [Dehalococcoidia bacterium]